MPPMSRAIGIATILVLTGCAALSGPQLFFGNQIQPGSSVEPAVIVQGTSTRTWGALVSRARELSVTP